jgi:hypothetical protein
MDANTLIRDLERLGIRLQAVGEKLEVNGTRKATLAEAHREAIKRLKPELLARLQAEKAAPEPKPTERIRAYRPALHEKPANLEPLAVVIPTLQRQGILPCPDPEGQECLTSLWPLIQLAHTDRLDGLTLPAEEGKKARTFGEVIRHLSAAIFYGQERGRWQGWLAYLKEADTWVKGNLRTEADFALLPYLPLVDLAERGLLPSGTEIRLSNCETASDLNFVVLTAAQVVRGNWRSPFPALHSSAETSLEHLRKCDAAYRRLCAESGAVAFL